MVTRNVKSRIVQKHDSEANWKKATGFAPMDGELIVYQKDANNGVRLKIGDGTTNVNNLNFVNDAPAVFISSSLLG